MTHRHEDDALELPPELAELDQELSSIWIEERPSFGPELLAELERVYEEQPESVAVGTRGRLIAAGVGALMVGGLAVPQARASLAALMPWTEIAETVALDARTLPEALPVPTPTLDPSEFGQPLVLEIPAPATAFESSGAAPLADAGVTRRADDANVPPQLIDRDAFARATLEAYPMDLQLAGIGGTVDLSFWVRLDGTVDGSVQINRGSGNSTLDVAAAEVVRSLRFHPGRRDGVPVGNWAELRIVFEAADGPPPAEPAPIETPTADVVAMELPDVMAPEVYLTPPPALFEAQELLREALRSEAERGGRWEGQVRSLLTAEPPAGALPNTWLREATAALERAKVAAPTNPAPLLALARVRRSQGLTEVARRELEEGIARATRVEDGSTGLLAELYYELGLLVQAEWRASRSLGRLPAAALGEAVCETAPGVSNSGAWAGLEALSSLNEVCPEELGRVLSTRFETLPIPLGSGRVDMVRAFELAAEAEPTHAGANVAILLELADERRWDDLLDRAQAFVWESAGHPHGLLMSGLALERLGHPERALDRFETAMETLAPEEVRALTDIGMLLDERRAVEWDARSEADRAAWAASFWGSLDPILTTEVNERVVEHLARSSYAYLRFGDPRSEAGRLWVRYGRPFVVRAFGGEAGTRTEFWDYGGGPDVVFHRSAHSDELKFSPESRVYLDQLLSVLPHRYFSESLRVVRTLDAQVSRFLARGGAVELEIGTAVPDELVTGSDDEIRMSVFLLDGRGTRMTSQQQVLPAIQQPIEVRYLAPKDAKQVVVELYHEELGMAVSLREGVPLPGSATGPFISDLFVLEAADPAEDEVRRTAEWVVPNIGLMPEDGIVGVLFELYELPAEEDYRLRVFLDGPNARGVPVSFKPAGEGEYRAVWRRTMGGAYRVTEYLTLDLRGFDPGEYGLRIEADVAGPTERLSTTRPIRIQ